MILAEIVLGARHWLTAASVIAVAAVALVVWSYLGARSTSFVRLACSLLKVCAFGLLALCLVEPLYVGTRPRPGSNQFLLLADNSRSLQLANAKKKISRGAALQARLTKKTDWLTRLQQDFDVRNYRFDTNLQPIEDFASLTFDGEASGLARGLRTLADRYRGQPVAGILLFTDGNATDLGENQEWKDLPPVYPVAVASEAPTVDVSVAQVAVSQTNFEAAPVTITADIETQALNSGKVIIRLLDEKGAEVERQTLPVTRAGERLSSRFLVRPERSGVTFYTVQAALPGEEDRQAGVDKTREATLANNRRLATVDRGGGPFRVLYVSGLPNWEFKFLRRAVAKDDEVKLAGLVRIARKEPKFKYLSREQERTNPLFRGFGNKNDEQAEQYDEPVLLRLGTEDKDELRGGFPKDAADLYKFHAVILDDVEAAFFTQDQMSLLQQFVSQRGGGLMMMGGKASYAEGGFARTPVAEMLPVYLDRAAPVSPGEGYRLKLTREGWLQPWIRVRANEEDESQRLAGMPNFQSLNRIGAIKPGASVLAEVESPAGTHPAIAVQPFGHGRVAALLVGDLWRWGLRRADHTDSDLEKAWRQTIRWLVADVPRAVEVEARRSAGMGLGSLDLVVRARDERFAPLDNAGVSITVTAPDERKLQLTAESSSENAGEYRTLFVPRVAGAYRAQVEVTAADGRPVGQKETGWAVEPETEEFRKLNGNRQLLDRIAAETGGEVLELSGLDAFVSSLPNRKIPVTESWTDPLWHRWSVLGVVMVCLVGEWGLRRWRGLP